MLAAPVAVTGIGILSPLGIGREATAEALASGRANIEPPTLFDASLYGTQRAGEVPGFAPKAFVETPKTYLDRCTALTLAACYLAVRDANLPWAESAPVRRSISHGTAFGCLDSMVALTSRVQSSGARSASPIIFSHSFINAPASLAAIEYSVRGPAPTFASGDLAGAEALVYGASLVASGAVDFCLAGGTEALSEPLYAALDDAGRLAAGLTPAEAAVMLVLEPVKAVGDRGARILATISAAALAGEASEELVAIGASDVPLWSAPVDWGHAFGAEFPLRVSVAIITGLERAAVTMDTELGAAAVVLEATR
ncbi:MAG: hypothetical protein N2512_10935 [Armatimonadetes bacterium]|nr:hypothetical protein [Armatimonadota bacterium]